MTNTPQTDIEINMPRLMVDDVSAVTQEFITDTVKNITDITFLMPMIVIVMAMAVGY